MKFVMIAGPSSSGKTTFSHRLSIQLSAHGLKPHPIAVDNYFVNREDTPRDENGNYNFECLEAIDVELFNRDMNALLNGERVEKCPGLISSWENGNTRRIICSWVRGISW